MNYQEFFKDKKVTQLGLGLLGRGVGDAIFMLENGVTDLIVTDKKTAEELAPSIAKLQGYKNLTLRLGEHRLEDFENRDFILKGAGVSLNSSYIAHAREKGIPIEMDSSLFCKLLPEDVTTIGVTGTRGKSTVTHMIYEALRNTTDPETIHLGGNIRNMATLELLPRVKSGDTVVLELDSWQLQGFGEAKISPHIAVVTNLMPDHQNYYPDMETYFRDKANIFLYQKPGDRLIVGASVLEEVKKLNPPVTPLVPEPLPDDWELQIPGIHNRENAALARAALSSILEFEEQWSTLTSFEGVEGRLQFVQEMHGVKIYNDNNATTPTATMVALEALNPKSEIRNKYVVLIVGGADKGLELEELIEKINQTCKSVILLPGSGSEKLKTKSRQLKTLVIEVPNLEEAIKIALSQCISGDILLFSPAFASFGLFKNEYERNDQFLKIIRAL